MNIHRQSTVDAVAPLGIERAQLPEWCGGSLKITAEEWFEQRLLDEGVRPTSPLMPLPFVGVSADFLSRFADLPAAVARSDALLTGTLFKQAGYVRRFNSRFCVLTALHLYYYADESSQQPEGVLPLQDATLTRQPDSTTFLLKTAEKSGLFDARSESLTDEWFTAVSAAIARSNTPAVAAAPASQIDECGDHVKPAAAAAAAGE